MAKSTFRLTVWDNKGDEFPQFTFTDIDVNDSGTTKEVERRLKEFKLYQSKKWDENTYYEITEKIQDTGEIILHTNGYVHLYDVG